MPTDPNHAYVDVPHPKTVQQAGWTYGCHSEKRGPGPRGRTVEWIFQDGWRYVQRGDVLTREPVMIRGKTDFKPMLCGHIEQIGRGSDPQCKGCENQTF